MLHIVLEHLDSDLCSISLNNREKPIYKHIDGSEVDIAAHSGIIVPENEYVGFIPVSSLEECTRDIPGIRFRDEFLAERDALVDTLHTMFTKVRGYEQQRVQYDKAYDGKGIDRNAQVSITGMGVLRGFDSPALRCIPNLYHTTNEDAKIIALPEFSNGCKVFLPILDYFKSKPDSE